MVFLPLLIFIALAIRSADAFDVSFGVQTCDLVQVTLTLEPFEYQQGSSFSVYGGANQATEIATVQLAPYFSSSTLTHGFTFDPSLYTTSGSYPFKFGIYNANGNPIGFNGNANDPDTATKTLTLTCSSTPSPSPTRSPSPVTTIVSTTTRYPSTSYMTSTYIDGCGNGHPYTLSVINGQTYSSTFAPAATSCSSPTPTPLPVPQNNAAVIGGAVGGSLGGLALLAGLIVFFLRRRKSKQDAQNHLPVFSPALDVLSSSDPEKESVSHHDDGHAYGQTDSTPHQYGTWSSR